MKKHLILTAALGLVLVACSEGGGRSINDVPNNTPPMITGQSAVSVPEGTQLVTQVTADDFEGNPITFSLSGADAGSFSISGSGEIRFVVPSDFENPADTDADNVYNITVLASDGFVMPSSFDITITVTDVEGDSIPEVSNLVTTDDTTFVEENIIESFEFPVLLQMQMDRVTLSGVFNDPGIAQNGWNNFEGPDAARIGERSVSTCEITGTPGDCDAPQGQILIQDFEVTQPSITFLMSGGAGNNNVGAEIIWPADNSVLARYTPNSCGDPFLKGDQHYVHFETVGLIGEEVQLRIFDEESGGCGFVAFDHFYMTDEPRGVNAGSASKPLLPTNVSLDPAAAAGLIPGGSFESPVANVDFLGWTATGAFASPTATSWEGTIRFPEAAHIGDTAISTCEMNDNAAGCDAPTGTLTSPSFKVTEDFINFLLAGGDGGVPVGGRIVAVDGTVIHEVLANTCGPAFVDGDNDWTWIDMSALRDAFVKFQLFDNHPGGCGFVSIDHVYRAPAAFNPAGSGRDGGAATLTAATEPKVSFNVSLPDDAFDQVIGDFDDATANNWTKTGAFANPAGADSWRGVSGVARVGARAVTTCEINNNAQGCDAPTGTLTSPMFAVDGTRPFLNFLMGGGNGAAPVGLNVKDSGGNTVATFTPNSCGPAFIDGDDDWVTIDLTAQAGQMVQVEIFDNEPGGCGFVSFDHVHMSATAKQL